VLHFEAATSRMKFENLHSSDGNLLRLRWNKSIDCFWSFFTTCTVPFMGCQVVCYDEPYSDWRGRCFCRKPVQTKCRKGPSIKDVRSQGGEKFVQCGYFADKGGFFKCRRPHFSKQKTSHFWKFMVCTHGQGGRGSIFRDFVRTSFMDRPKVEISRSEYRVLMWSSNKPEQTDVCQNELRYYSRFFKLFW